MVDLSENMIKNDGLNQIKLQLFQSAKYFFQKKLNLNISI